MQQQHPEDKKNSLCAWCGDQIMGEDGFVIEGKERTIVNIRDNISILCSQEHAKLYIELPGMKCHFMSPHNCKLIPPNIAIATVECDCPGKHLFCCQEIKDCFNNDTIPEDSELHYLNEISLDLLVEGVVNRKEEKLGDKEKRCKTCSCGYREFRYCNTCGELRCSICNALDRCSTCSMETFTQKSLRYTGMKYLASFVVTQRNPNKTPDICPQCYVHSLSISYLLSPCGHMCCSVCYSKKIQKCIVCSKKIETLDIVFQKYWATKDYKPDIILSRQSKFIEL